MDPSARRSLCIVSRDPLQCSELVLSLQACLDPDDEVEIVMDRRREGARESDAASPDGAFVDRRRNHHVDLEVRTKGFAIVPAPMSSRPVAPAEPEDDRARFENILSFRRKREARPGRVVGVAGAAMVALVLSPPVTGLSELLPGLARYSDSFARPAPTPSGAVHAVTDPTTAERAPAPSSPARAQPGAPTGTRAQQGKSGSLEAYAARIEDATGRLASRARGFIERVASEVVGTAPAAEGPGLQKDDGFAATAAPRPAQSP